MDRINKESIAELLSEKAAKNGLHVRDIAANLMNQFSGGLFPDKAPLEFEKVVKKVNRILNDSAKKRGGIFKKAQNPKTKRGRKGVYLLKRKNVKS